LDAQLFGNHLSIGEDSDIFEHRLTPVAKTRSLHGDDFQRATDLVYHQSGQGFAFNLFGDDEQWFASFRSGFKHWEKILHAGNLFLVDEQVAVFVDRLHAFRIGHEIWRKIATIKSHAFDQVQSCFQPFGFLDGNDTLFSYLVHRLGQDVSDGLSLLAEMVPTWAISSLSRV